MWSAVFTAFPTGSVYDFKKGQRGFSYRNNSFIRDEAVEWKRPSQLTEAEKRAADRQWADGVVDPTVSELMEMEIEDDSRLWTLSEAQRKLLWPPVTTDGYVHGDHSKCQHPKGKAARRACRRRHGSTGGR